MSNKKEELMEVKRVLRMGEGIGETSYASNSAYQKSVSVELLHLVKNAVHELCSESSHVIMGKTISIADMGCSSGPNSLWAVSKIINMIDSKLPHLPSRQYLIYLNDLESNDFNTVFKTFLPPFYEKLKTGTDEEIGPNYFVAAMPGSFYGRLFPDKSLHFVHSCFALHWISQVPVELEDEFKNALNKGNISIGESSPPIVFEAYSKQFHRDFSSYLKARSMEIVDGGKMVVILAGRRTGIKGYPWFSINRAVQNAVSQGCIEESKMDTFNLPMYNPSMDEVKDIIASEGSFHLNQCEGMDCKIGKGEYNEKGEVEINMLVKITRAKFGPIIAAHFGEDAMDIIFENYREVAKDYWEEESYRFLIIGISLTRKKNT